MDYNTIPPVLQSPFLYNPISFPDKFTAYHFIGRQAYDIVYYYM